MFSKKVLIIIAAIALLVMVPLAFSASAQPSEETDSVIAAGNPSLASGPTGGFEVKDLQGNTLLTAHGKKNSSKKNPAISPFSTNSASISAIITPYSQTVPVLLYHGITPTAASNSVVTPETFQDQMTALKNAGYRVISTSNLYYFLNGTAQAKEKSVLITFDDGRKDAYYNGDPILKSVSYKAAMFVIAHDSLDGPKSTYYLDANELKAMISSGRWEIQAHSYAGHDKIPINKAGTLGVFFGNKKWLADLNRLETDNEFKARIDSDLKKNRTTIRDYLNVYATKFAVPYNDYGQNRSNDANVPLLAKAVFKNNFIMSFYQFKPQYNVDYTQNYYNSGEYFAKRLTITNDISGSSLVQRLKGGSQKLLPYAEDFSNPYNWALSYGSYAAKDSNLSVGGDMNSTLLYLDGSYFWKDYNFNVIADNTNVPTTSIIGRFHDSTNFFTCNFRPEKVWIDAVQNNVRSTVASIDMNAFARGSNVSLGIQAVGNSASCIIEGSSVLNYTGSLIPENGGAGFKFSNYSNNSPLVVTSITAALP